MTDSTADDQPLTAEEASAFSAKLETFSQTLTDREKAILNGLLANASAAVQDDEVAGFSYGHLTLRKSGGEKVELITGFGQLSTGDLSQTALAPMTGSSLHPKIEG